MLIHVLFSSAHLKVCNPTIYTHNGDGQRLQAFLVFNNEYLPFRGNHEVGHIQWDQKVFSQPPIVQVPPLKKMTEACNFHHWYTSTMRDRMGGKNPGNHIVGFLMN